MPSRISPEYILKLTQRLIDAKAELAAAQKEWEAAMGQHAAIQAFGRPKQIRSNGISSRIQEFLNAHPGQPFTAEEVATKLNLKINTVKTTISRLASDGFIIKVSRSAYGSATRPALAEADAFDLAAFDEQEAAEQSEAA